MIAVSWVEPHRSIHIRHADEEDPELMAQDYEEFPPPRQRYNDGFISEDDFDHILEYSDMCDKHGSDAVDDYMEFHDELDNFEEAYCGEWDSEEDFARHIVDECYDLKRRWAISLTISTTKPSDATCSCTTTRWAQTATCSALSDPESPSLLASSRHQGRLEIFTNMFQIINCAFKASNKG